MVQTSIAQPSTSLLDEKFDSICCHYVNNSSHIHVVKLIGVRDYHLERTVFPGQQLLFEASPDAQLEIFTGEIVQAIVKDRIPCRSLCVQQSESVPQNSAVYYNMAERHGFRTSTSKAEISIKADVQTLVS